MPPPPPKNYIVAEYPMPSSLMLFFFLFELSDVLYKSLLVDLILHQY